MSSNDSSTRIIDEFSHYVVVSGEDVDRALGLETVHIKVSSALWRAFRENCAKERRAVNSVLVQLVEAQMRGIISLPEIMSLSDESIQNLENENVFRH